MTENRPTVLIDRPRGPEPRASEMPVVVVPRARVEHPVRAVQPAEHQPAQDPAPPTRGPRRWSDPDEKFMLWGMVGFFALGLYAAIFVAFGMWLTP